MTTYKKPMLVLIAGGGGAGKTTATRKIIEAFGNEITWIADAPNNYNFRRWQDNQKTDPNKIDHELFYQHLKDLKSGKDINFPFLDYDNQRRGPDQVLKPNKIILVEGEYALYF